LGGVGSLSVISESGLFGFRKNDAQTNYRIDPNAGFRRNSAKSMHEQGTSPIQTRADRRNLVKSMRKQSASALAHERSEGVSAPARLRGFLSALYLSRKSKGQFLK